MKKTLLVAAILMVFSVPVLACAQGAAEYPQIAEALEKAELPADQKAALSRLFEKGRAMHAEGERTNDFAKMGEALEILDQVKGAIGQ